MLDSLFDDDDDERPAAPASSARGPGTQTAAPSLAPGSTYSAAVELDTGPGVRQGQTAHEYSQKLTLNRQSSQPDAMSRPRHGTLKRRANAPSTSLFPDDDDDGDDLDIQPPRKKTREERLRDIMEEDDRRAQELASQHSQQEKSRRDGGNLSVVNEEPVAVPVKAPAAGSSHKRQAAIALSSDIEDTSTSARKAKSCATSLPARKRLRSASVQPSDEDATAAGTSIAKANQPAATAKGKAGGTAAARRKAEKDAQALEQKNLLVVKPTKRKGDTNDQAFTAEFNALKIVKPVLQPMRKPESRKMGWDEEDPEEERNRLIREDHEREDNPDDWGGKATQMFVIHKVSLARKERPPPRNDLQLEGKYAGRPNFKRFRVS